MFLVFSFFFIRWNKWGSVQCISSHSFSFSYASFTSFSFSFTSPFTSPLVSFSSFPFSLVGLLRSNFKFFGLSDFSAFFDSFSCRGIASFLNFRSFFLFFATKKKKRKKKKVKIANWNPLNHLHTLRRCKMSCTNMLPKNRVNKRQKIHQRKLLMNRNDR